MNEMSRDILYLFTFFAVSVNAFPDYSDSCGCHLICRDKFDSVAAVAEGHAIFLEEKLQLEKQKEACSAGCRFYQAVISRPEHRNLPPELEKQVAQTECQKRCSITYTYRGKEEHKACEGGCEDGCLFYPNRKGGPKVKLTIVVEETITRNEIPMDKSDLEPILNDPGLRPQIEDTQSPNDVLSKIPSSSFTNLPVSHDNDGCGEEFHLCDTWMESQSTVCVAAIFLLAAALLVMFWRSRNDTYEEQASTLPEKVPLCPTA